MVLLKEKSKTPTAKRRRNFAASKNKTRPQQNCRGLFSFIVAFRSAESSVLSRAKAKVGQAVPDKPLKISRKNSIEFDTAGRRSRIVFRVENGWKATARLTQHHFGNHLRRGCQAQPDLRAAIRLLVKSTRRVERTSLSFPSNELLRLAGLQRFAQFPKAASQEPPFPQVRFSQTEIISRQGMFFSARRLNNQIAVRKHRFYYPVLINRVAISIPAGSWRHIFRPWPRGRAEL